MKTRIAIRSAKTPTQRRGIVLVIVLVVVALLALGAYTFSEFMITEAQGTIMFGREAQAAALADSGLELAASLLANRTQENPQSYYHNPEWFQGILVCNSAGAKGRGRFSLVAPVESDLSGHSVRFGMIDESSKLNINTILSLGLDDDDARTMLMGIPNMTMEIADAMLDYVDADQTVRQYGCENEYYQTLSPPYQAKNASLDSLDELLMVRGVTPDLLFGEDANRNGLLDPNENDGAASPPLDNSDGMLQHGWSAYLTVSSREINRRSDGEERINVNMTSLADLYDKVAQEFDENTAKFIIACRINGPSAGGSSSSGTPLAGASGGSSAARSVTPTSVGGLSGSSTVSATQVGQGQSSGGSSTVTPTQIAANQGIQQLATTVGQMLFSTGGSVTRGGIDVTNGGSQQITSLYQFFGASARAQVNGSQTTFTSPWSSDPSDMTTYLPTVMDKLTTRADRFIDGRLNINQARRELLMGIPGMTDALADGIVGAQVTGTNGQSLSSQAADRGTTGWLVINGLTDLPTMQQLDPYMTARGDVFRVQSVGYFDGGGPMARVEAVIDATENPPRVVFLRDLTHLGRGFSAQLLTIGAGGS